MMRYTDTKHSYRKKIAVAVVTFLFTVVLFAMPVFAKSGTCYKDDCNETVSSCNKTSTSKKKSTSSSSKNKISSSTSKKNTTSSSSKKKSSSSMSKKKSNSSSKKKTNKVEMPDCDDYDSYDDFMDDWDGSMPDGSDAEDYWENW